MYKELREESRKKFDDVGEGYGEMIFYQGRNVASLLECQKTIKKCGKLINADEFENMLKAEQNEGANMLDLNERIYHQRIPQGHDVCCSTVADRQAVASCCP